jgi:hypothetical protein
MDVMRKNAIKYSLGAVAIIGAVVLAFSIDFSKQITA